MLLVSAIRNEPTTQNFWLADSINWQPVTTYNQPINRPKPIRKFCVNLSFILQFPVEFKERQFFTVLTLHTIDEGGHTLKVKTCQNMKMSETCMFEM